jgi:hypothetical protein
MHTHDRTFSIRNDGVIKAFITHHDESQARGLAVLFGLTTGPDAVQELLSEADWARDLGNMAEHCIITHPQLRYIAGDKTVAALRFNPNAEARAAFMSPWLNPTSTFEVTVRIPVTARTRASALIGAKEFLTTAMELIEREAIGTPAVDD